VAVVVDLAKLSLGREDYYLREIAGNREECLSGHGESPRVAASRLALEGADGRFEAEGAYEQEG
jgi:hypothetical protein